VRLVVAGVQRKRISALLGRERERFVAERPRSSALRDRASQLMPGGVPMSWLSDLSDGMPPFAVAGEGAWFTDVDGHRYLDVNIADTSMFCGYGPPAVVQAVSEAVRTGTQFLLPGEDSIVVARALAERYGMAKWQFTLAATSANVEAMRLARRATGRGLVLMFEGKYHGHADEMQTMMVDGEVVDEAPGLAPGNSAGVRLVPFNDPDALRDALRDERVACVLTEPAMTNTQGVIQPLPGFHGELRRATRETGTVLILDETHTQICGHGGLTGRLGLQPDILTIGKSIGGGVPIGAYGMTDELAGHFEGWTGTGGTLFGNALSMAAARAALTEVLTPEVYDRTASLGARISDGIDRIADAAGLPWRAHRLYARAGYCFSGTQPTNAADARADLDSELWSLLRTFMANRGVWEAIEGAGPAVSVPATEADVDHYLGALDELAAELTS
jgi:glutamate-1-semialdehyde 2,1-aminomutase